MTIEKRVLERLDFPKILERLEAYCLLPKAKEMAEALEPFTDYETVELALKETEEGKIILRSNPSFSVRGAKEIRPFLERSLRGGILTADELLGIKETLRTGRQIRQTITESKEELPRLREIVSWIIPKKNLEDEIGRCITEEGSVADEASSELAELRRAKHRLQRKIRESLDAFLRNPAYQKMLQEPIITQRSDRYVIPVKQEYRGSFPGIVHDQSASGATLFIEPMPVVQLGNELREVSLKEEREVRRVLQILTEKVEDQAEEIGDLYEALARIDFILAKAHLAGEMNAGAPILVRRQEIKLVQARHPLLKGYVVPLTVELGIDFDMLVITGPNTGGKTVALKTIGLLTAMAQSGLHIPAESDSRMGVFTQIFADIGDEQSVEQSLSTFSAHLKNIVQIVDHADQRSLILLDEVGAGTDPTEGAALAMGILAELHERHALIVATTHYGVLKTFAYDTPRVKNASVEFDVETLRPTYKLLVGIPGKSNAFTIAGRYGLSERVIERAKSFMSEREMQVEDLIENLGETHREIELAKRKVEEERRAAEEQSRNLQEKSLKLEEDYENIIASAKDEAAEIIRQVRREAEELIAQLKEALKKEQKEQQDIERARQGLNRISAKLDGQHRPRVSGGLTRDQLKLGQTVYMTNLRQKGQVLKLPNENGDVLVQAGIMKVMVPLSQLRAVPEEKKSVVTGRNVRAANIGRSKVETVRNEIDLRGMLVQEATEELDKYLDDAVLSGVSQVYIIHGKGTGALRSGVQEFLRGHPHVKSFRLGQHGEGDLGVTVVELK